MATYYKMQAVDDTAGTLHVWLATSKDFSGAGFTGPNSPLSSTIAVVAALDASVAAGSGLTSVTAYGATGDGTTDDTTAIQAAMTAASAASQVLYFPPGTYLVTSALTSPGPLSIAGAGIGESIVEFNCTAGFTGISFGASTTFGRVTGAKGLTFVNAGADGLYCLKTPSQADQYSTYDQKFIFEDLEFRGDTFTGGAAYYPATDQTFTAGHLFIGDCKFARVSNIKINGAFDVYANPSGQVTDSGIVIAPTTAALTVRVQDLELAALHTAFEATGNAFYSLNNFDFIGVYRGVTHTGGSEAKIQTGIINAQDYGIYMDDCFSRSIVDVDVQRLSGGWSGATNNWYGVRLDNVSTASIVGMKLQHGAGAYGGGFTTYGIYADNGTAGLKISDCNFGVGTDVGVYLDNVAGFSVSDSMLSNSDAMTYVYLATNSRYGSILGVAQSTSSVTHTMIDDDGSVSETSYSWLTENVTGFTRRPFGGTLTISSGSVSPTKSFHLLDTESAAASDDLDTIVAPTVFPYWTELELRTVSSSRDVTLKDGTGNLRLAGDFTLADANHWIRLVYDGSVWKETSRSANTNGYGTFANTSSNGGNPTLSVAPDLAAEFAQLTDTATRDYDYDPGVDGYYTLKYEFRLVTGGGAYRKLAIKQDFKRVSGVCSLEGSSETEGVGVQTGVAVVFSIVSDDVRASLTNTTGSTLDGHYWRRVTSGDLPS